MRILPRAPGRPYLFLAAAWLAGILLAGSVAEQAIANANAPGTPGRRIGGGARPFTQSLADMARRDARIRALQPAGYFQVRGEETPEEELDFDVPLAPEDGAHFPPPGASRRKGAVKPLGLGPGFFGIALNDQTAAFRGLFFFPPDTMGAIGPDHFLEIVNGSVALYTRAGVRLSHVSLASFFQVVESSVTYPRGHPFDPHVLYDRQSGHWFATCLEHGVNESDNRILLAVSRTADPSGTWDKYALPTNIPDEVDNNYFADFDTLGVDSNGVYISAAFFPLQGRSFSRLFAMPKAPLIAANPSLGSTFRSDDHQDGFGTPQPAHTLDAVGPADRAWFVASSAFATQNLEAWSVTWSGGTPTFSDTLEVLTPSFGKVMDFTPGGSSKAVDTGDHRMLMAVVRNGQLWTCRTVGVNASGTSSGADRTACEWLQVDARTAAPSLVQSGRVYDPAATDPRFYFGPSLAVNGQGNMALSFSGARASEFLGAFTCGRLAGDALGTIGAPVLLRGGEGPYTISQSEETANRWGDYTFSSVDPRDDQTLWTIQEYAKTGPNVWGTWVASLQAPAPTLTGPTTPISAGTTGVSILLNGSGLFDPGPSFAGRPTASIAGGGIQNLAVSVQSPTALKLTFDLEASAAVGARDITFTNPDGQSVTLTGGLSVLASGTVPSAPTNLAAAPLAQPEGRTRLELSWKDGSDIETGFRIERAQGGSGFASVGTTGSATGTGSTVRFTDSGLLPRTTYQYRVVATGSAADSPPSEVASGTTLSGPPAAPTGLKAVAANSSGVDLKWTDNSDDETAFLLERSEKNGPFQTLGRVGTDIVSYRDTRVKPATAYAFRVRAESAVGASEPAETKLTTPAAGKAVVSPLSINFGSGKVGKAAKANVQVKNAGTGPLTVTASTLQGPFSVLPGFGNSAPIGAGKTRVVKVQFAPIRKGSFSATLTLTTSDPAKRTVKVQLKGKGT